MVRRFRDWWERRGLTQLVAIVWFPFWLILAVLLPHDGVAPTICLAIMGAPLVLLFALAGLAIFGAPFFITRPLDRLGAVIIIGGALYALFGTMIAAIYLAAMVAVWLLRDGWRAFKAKGNDLITPSAAAYRHAPLE